MVRSPAGEDWIVSCSSCDYRANLERAVSRLSEIEDGAPQTLERFPTPDIRTIAALAQAFPDIAQPERQIKTLVYMIDDKVTLVLMRGDHELLEQKLIDTTGSTKIRAAQADEIKAALGASAGSLGAVNANELTVIADNALDGRSNMVTGANEDDFHYRGVTIGEHIRVDKWAELRTIREGEACVRCGSPLEIWKGIEVGHIFKLGTKYTEVMGALVQDENGESRPIVMGSYGIGLERNMAAVVEASHDEKGIIWPVSIAPYEVVLTVLRADDPATMAAAEDLYKNLRNADVEVIIDDRLERPGVKFADAELIGFPYRLTVGPKGVAAGTVELTTRAGLTTEDIAIDNVLTRIQALLMPT
jgi:prolyl-tRNA synthetase